ncbi:hypothetical protein [Silvibacterium sp.]|uniref:hypothetical protein n=1 Tax=Silvibacterium sp. TaxID=1964179 RepID=UPI0039E6AE78
MPALVASILISRKRILLGAVYLLATIQFAWCYFWLTHPYINTALYEQGHERMPFQGRLLMMLPMRLSHTSVVLRAWGHLFRVSSFWFPRPVAPEVILQAIINVICLLLAGYFTTRIYRASSRHGLLTPLVYPLFLVACAATYVMHTVQNFRFIYDLPSLAFFSAGLYLLYFRRPVGWFVGLFLVATINRETTLLLLPLFLINEAVELRPGANGPIRWRKLFAPRSLAVVLPLSLFWIGWQYLVRHHFAHNASEFYPRLNWNVKSLVLPQAWPQLLSASAYMLLFVIVMHRRITDARLRAWLWILPVWTLFMFVYGILVETRVFGELIPYTVCCSTLILEQILLARLHDARPALAAWNTGRPVETPRIGRVA